MSLPTPAAANDPNLYPELSEKERSIYRVDEEEENQRQIARFSEYFQERNKNLFGVWPQVEAFRQEIKQANGRIAAETEGLLHKYDDRSREYKQMQLVRIFLVSDRLNDYILGTCLGLNFDRFSFCIKQNLDDIIHTPRGIRYGKYYIKLDKKDIETIRFNKILAYLLE